MKPLSVIVLTLVAWAIAITAVGLWRVTYGWYPGAFIIFMFQDVPVFSGVLIFVLFFEWLALRKRLEPRKKP
jgi:hypothetical protein